MRRNLLTAHNNTSCATQKEISIETENVKVKSLPSDLQIPRRNQ